MATDVPIVVRPKRIHPHAVERFIQRHQKGLGDRAARKLLAQLLVTATLHEVEQRDRTVWRTTSGILLGVQGDEVRTVLPLGSRRPSRRPRKRTS